MELLKRVIPLELLVWLDSVAQWTGEWWQYTPSVFLRARAVGDTPSAAQDGFFKCPACGYHPLDVGAEALVCSSCKRRWESREGIYDFRDR